MKKLLFVIFLTGCLPKEGKQPFMKVVSSSFSKELCSCLFVVGQKEEYCTAYAKQLIPVTSYQIQNDFKKVTSVGMGIVSSATYQSERLGCRLD